jgi:hypothetical protein
VRHWKQEKAEKKHHPDMRRPQHLRRNDLERGIKVEERNADRDRRYGDADPAAEAIKCAFLLFDISFDLGSRIG